MNRFSAYLLLVFVLPLPFGGVVDWAWPWLCAAAIGLLLAELQQLRVVQQAFALPQLPLPVAFVKGLPLLGLLVLVQLWVWMQWGMSWSLSAFDTLMSLLLGFGLTAFFALSLLVLNSRERVVSLVWVVVLAAAFQALFGALMVLSGLEYGFFIEKQHYRNTATGTFINRNHLAGYLELALALGIGFLLAQSAEYRGSWRQRLRQLAATFLSNKVLMRLLLAVMVIALVLTRSRMGNTAFFVSLLITGALALVLMRNKSRSTTILLASLLVIDIAIVGTFFGVEKVAERIRATSSETESRPEVSRDTLSMWRDHAMTGIGAGTFTHVYPAFKSADVLAPQVYNNAHNDYAQFLAEFGVPGFLLLLIFGLWCLWWSIAAMRLRRNDLFKGMGFAACMAMVAVAVHSLVDFNLQIPANSFTFMLLLSLAVIARWAPQDAQPLPARG